MNNDPHSKDETIANNSYMGQSDSIATIQPKPQSWRSWILFIVVASILVVIIAGAVINALVSSVSQTTSEEFLEDETIMDYVSSNHGFRVKFSGFPEISNETIDVKGYKVPYTTYIRETESGEKVYMVAVYDYGLAALSPSEISLEGGLNGMAHGMNATINSTTTGTLGNQDALEGHMTTEFEGKSYVGYARLIQQNMKIINVATVGSTYSEFESFAASFRLE